jgi:Mn-dependent DtxR family transcriptional regulator
MGPQPWPKGKARTVAEQMGVSRMIVHEAIRELIRKGTFKMQVDGILYTPEEPAPSG